MDLCSILDCQRLGGPNHNSVVAVVAVAVVLIAVLIVAIFAIWATKVKEIVYEKQVSQTSHFVICCDY